MKKRAPKYLVFLVVLCAFFGGIIIWLLISKINTVDPESKEVQGLYSYIGDNYLDYCEGMPFYEDNKVTYEKLDNSTKLCLAYKLVDDSQIQFDELKKSKKDDVCNFNKTSQFRIDDETNKCSIEIIPIENLESAYFKLFGKEIEATEEFNLSGSRTCYFDEEESRYVCGNSVVQTLQLGWAPTTYRMITKAKEKGNELIIYDYYVAINNNKCYLTNSGDQENTKCSDKIDEKTKYNTRFVSKYGQKYIHTFEKDSDGNYHWISSTTK